MSANGSVSTSTADMALRPTTSFQRFSTYSGVRDDTYLTFGDDGDLGVKFNSTRNCVVVDGQGTSIEVRGLNMAPDRYELVERFNRKPGINADMASGTEAVREIANVDFELLGTNAVSADTSMYVEGGVLLATHGADADSSIILPHLDTSQSAWATTTWGTDQQARYEAVIQTTASVAAMAFWVGLKLTNTPTIATDNDQAAFFFDTTAGTSPTLIHTVYSIGGTDTEAAVGSAVAANTTYHFVVDIDSSRLARFYINSVLVTTSTALTTATDLIPYIGVKSIGGAAVKSIRVFKCAISRHAGA